MNHSLITIGRMVKDVCYVNCIAKISFIIIPLIALATKIKTYGKLKKKDCKQNQNSILTNTFLALAFSIDFAAKLIYN